MAYRGAREHRNRTWLPVAVGSLAGGAVGFGVSATMYLLLNPVLESSRSSVRELQGLLWNLVPLATVCGLVLGAWLVSRLRRSPR